MADAVIQRRLRRRNIGPLFADDFKGQASPNWFDWRLGKYDVPPVQTPNTSPNLNYGGDPLDPTKYAMRVTLNGGDYVTANDQSIGKQRAQLIWKPTVEQHRAYREMFYNIDLFFPDNFDYRNDDAAHNDWFFIPVQFHDRIFEETGASPGYQPVAGLYYDQTGAVGAGQSSYTLAYGLDGIGDTRQLLPNILIDRGRWHRWMLHFKWSRGGDGFVRAWLNKRFIVQANGRNIYPAQGDTPNTIDIGGYRGHGADAEQAQTTIHHMKNVRFAPTEQRLGLGA